MIVRFLPEIPVSVAIRVFVAFIVAVFGAYLATPRLSSIENAPSLENGVPRKFGDWTELKSPLLQVALSTGGDKGLNQPYDQVVMRTYRNSEGRVVQLALAWGANQRQEVKIHRPDLCYVAQGFKVKSLSDAIFSGVSTPHGLSVKGKRMIAEAGAGIEAVSYWIRIGDLYSEDAIDTRLKIFRDGLAGKIPDGILVRASMSGKDENEVAQLFLLNEVFLKELVAALSPSTRALLIQ